MSMFKNYPQPEGYIPDNRPKCHKPFELNIMAGETAKHTFEVPFNVEEKCNAIEVIYKLGLTNVITKNDYSLDIFSENNHSIITCDLTASETSIFTNSLLKARVQLRFIMLDNSVTYSEVYPVKILTALDATVTQPGPSDPSIILGIGYTED